LDNNIHYKEHTKQDFKHQAGLNAVSPPIEQISRVVSVNISTTNCISLP